MEAVEQRGGDRITETATAAATPVAAALAATGLAEAEKVVAGHAPPRSNLRGTQDR